MPGPKRTRRVGMHMRPSRTSTIAQCLSLNCTRLLPKVPSPHAFLDTKSYKRATRESAVRVFPQLLQENTLGNFVEGPDGLPNAAQWCSRGDVYCARFRREMPIPRPSAQHIRATSHPQVMIAKYGRICPLESKVSTEWTAVF